jgi:PAS domain S-box-containing protein
MSVSYNAAVYRDESGEVVGVFAAARDITERKRAEEALRESETRFRTFVDHAADALFIYDFEQGIIVDVNRQACESLGYTRQELIGKAPLGFHSESERAQLQSVAERAAAGETVIDRHSHRQKDGTLFPVEAHTSQFWYGGRRFLLKVARDISDRIRAEEALRESERKYHELVEHANSIILHWQRDGRIIFLNEFGQSFFGYTESEIRGRHVIGTIVPETESSGRDLEKLMQEICANPSAFEQNINENMRRNGEHVWIAWTNKVILNSKGEVAEILSVGTDITERRRAEEALRRSEAYLAEGQRLTHTGSFAWSAATRESLYWSEEMLRMYGFNPQEGPPATETFWQRIHPEDLDGVRELLLRVADQKTEYEHDHRIVLPDGTVKHIHAIGHPVLNNNGQVTEYVGTAIDVTEQKRVEQERERLRQLEADLAHINRVSMMGELTASIAHEVNQPLSGVVSNGSACLRWLAGDVPNVEEACEAARRIVRDGKRAGEVIARIRTLTRRAATPREKLDLNEIIRDVLALVGDEARKKGVIIRTQFVDELSPVSGDRVQLQQVLLNLAMNAMEAMSSVSERPRELVMATRNIDADQVQVTVKDSGPGIDPNTLDKIFDPFYTTKPHGMGMGLSICRSILQAHGGRLWAAAKDGPGTIFHFSLPKYQEEELHAAP